MTIYAILSNTGNWDSDSVGLLGFRSAPTAVEAAVGAARDFLVSPVCYIPQQDETEVNFGTSVSEIAQRLDDNELNCYYNGEPAAYAYVDGGIHHDAFFFALECRAAPTVAEPLFVPALDSEGGNCD